FPGLQSCWWSSLSTSPATLSGSYSTRGSAGSEARLDRRRGPGLARLARLGDALLDSVQRPPPQSGELDDTVQQHLRHDHRGEEGHGDADPEREREASDRAGAELEEDRGGEHRREVRIEDRRERALAAFLHRDPQGLTGAQLLLETLERENVRVHRHSDR